MQPKCKDFLPKNHNNLTQPPAHTGKLGSQLQQLCDLLSLGQEQAVLSGDDLEHNGREQIHHHAQGNYLPGPLLDDRGVCRYRLADGAVMERTQEEMDADYTPPEQRPTTEQRVYALETTTDDIILMMAELIGG